MPSVATQTDISMTTMTGYLGWLKANQDVADGLPKQPSPQELLKQARENSWARRNRTLMEQSSNY